MAYVPPTAETFKARYPEFASVPDSLITLVLQEAIDEVGDTWVERDRAKAQMLLAAHKLTLEGEPARSKTGKGTGNTGPIKRRKVGDVETEYAGASTGGASGASGQYAGSVYGVQYWNLLKLNFPSPAVY